MIVDILCPNYEDRERIDLNGNASCYPDMWLAEKYADGALWLERKAMAERTYFMARDKAKVSIHNWVRCMPADGRACYKILERSLLSLVRESGWVVRNEEGVIRYDVSPIYETRGRRIGADIDEDIKTCDDGIVIDNAVLSRMMSEYADALNTSPIRSKQRFPDKRKVQAYALAELVAANGWKEKRYNDVKFYKVG